MFINMRVRCIRVCVCVCCPFIKPWRRRERDDGVFIHTRLRIRRKRVKTTVAPNFFPHTPPPPPPSFYSRASDLFHANSSSKHRPHAPLSYFCTRVVLRNVVQATAVDFQSVFVRAKFNLTNRFHNVVDGDGRVIETRQ